MDAVSLRNLITHGWQKQDHEPRIQYRIKRYMLTGNPEYLHNTRYAKIREGLLPK